MIMQGDQKKPITFDSWCPSELGGWVWRGSSEILWGERESA